MWSVTSVSYRVTQFGYYVTYLIFWDVELTCDNLVDIYQYLVHKQDKRSLQNKNAENWDLCQTGGQWSDYLYSLEVLNSVIMIIPVAFVINILKNNMTFRNIFCTALKTFDTHSKKTLTFVMSIYHMCPGIYFHEENIHEINLFGLKYQVI